MKSNLIFLVLILLSVSNSTFVYDKRLLSNKSLGRDFSGTTRYGSFLYSGSCPPTTSGLTGISIALADSTGSSCFTDSSTAAVTFSIGYVCIPGSNGGPATVEFGFPGTNGFVIGGSNFAGVGVAEASLGFKWGSVGQPTYTGGSATASCTGTCSSTYCGGSCTATCSDSKLSTGEACSDTHSGGTFYFVPNAVNPSNCGSIGHCCTAFTYTGIVPLSLTLHGPNEPGLGALQPFGVPDTATYGNLFTPPAGAVTLNSFLFHINTNNVPINVRALVGSWNSATSRVNTILYQSSTFTINSNSFTIFSHSLSTPISVTPGNKYVAFFSTAGIQAGQPGSGSNWSWGNLIGSSNAVFLNHGDDTSQWTSSQWAVTSNTFVFTANFNGAKRNVDFKNEGEDYPITGTSYPTNSTRNF